MHPDRSSSNTPVWIIVGAILGGTVLCLGLPLVIVVCLTAIQILGKNANATFTMVGASIGTTVAAGQKPTPPLVLPEPPAPKAVLDGQDLRAADARQLRSRASAAAAKGDYATAVILQHWVVAQTDEGQYNLACYHARTGAVDAGFYWLQKATLTEGVDAEWANDDEDLATLRRDLRWPRVEQYLTECGAYWAVSGVHKTLVVLPKDYQRATPVTVVVWLHGLGSRPDGFVNDDAQARADKLNIALVGVSGTVARGPKNFAWSEDPAQDARRVEQALEEVSDRLTIKPGHVICLGFSQGGQMGLEIAVRNPERFAGAIALSPGLRGPAQLQDAPRSPLLAQRGFVVVVGAKEHPGNVSLAASDADWLRTATAQVQHKAYPGVTEHAFPDDFDERFPEWVRFIEKVRGE